MNESDKDWKDTGKLVTKIPLHPSQEQMNIQRWKALKGVYANARSKAEVKTAPLKSELNLNPVNTQIGTWTHSPIVEIAHLFSGLNEAQLLYVSTQKEFARGKVIGKSRFIDRERHSIDRLWNHLRRQEALGDVHSTDRLWFISKGENGFEIWGG